jgi:hypothetical protein
MRFQKAVLEVDRGTIERISLAVDPYQTGFGKIPKPGAVRSPPLCRIREGILGVDPAHGTRGGVGAMMSSAGEVLIALEPPTRGWHPTETARVGRTNAHRTPPHFASIGRFVGYLQQPQIAEAMLWAVHYPVPGIELLGRILNLVSLRIHLRRASGTPGRSVIRMMKSIIRALLMM